MDRHTIEAIIAGNLERHRQVCERLAGMMPLVERAAALMIQSLKNDGRVLFCGNGGSAADAQHLAAELSGRYLLNRPALDAEALHVNTSALTAIANDFGYETVFSRQVEAHGRPGDTLVAISTSGGSANVVKAAEAARRKYARHCHDGRKKLASGRYGGRRAGGADGRDASNSGDAHSDRTHAV